MPKSVGHAHTKPLPRPLHPLAAAGTAEAGAAPTGHICANCLAFYLCQSIATTALTTPPPSTPHHPPLPLAYLNAVPPSFPPGIPPRLCPLVLCNFGCAASECNTHFFGLCSPAYQCTHFTPANNAKGRSGRGVRRGQPRKSGSDWPHQHLAFI